MKYDDICTVCSFLTLYKFVHLRYHTKLFFGVFFDAGGFKSGSLVIGF